MPRVLITGAAGFIGMHTSIRFLNEGWKVVGLDNMNDYYSVQLKKDRILNIESSAYASNQDFIFFERDLNSDVWGELAKMKFDLVIHLAAQAGVRYSIENPMAYLESNILGFQRVLEFIELSRPKKFLYASSSSVYGQTTEQPFKESAPCNSPVSYYAATKKTNELMARAYFETHGISSIGLRFFTVYGAWGRPDMAPLIFTSAAFEGRKIKVFNNGNQKRDFTHINDIVNGIYSLSITQNILKGASIFNIGNGKPTQLMDFIRLIEVHSKTTLEKEFVPSQLGDVRETYADITEISTIIDYKPSMTLEDGISDLIDWYRRYERG